MKSVLIIGMGKFGHHLCEELVELGNDVMVVDQDEEKVSDLIYNVTNVQIGDCTNPHVVKSLGVGNFDIVFVCIGMNFQNSLEITSLVKEMGAKFVISKANRDVHAKFLMRNGADKVIYPDKDMALRIAKKYSANHVLDFIEIDDEYSICEITTPKSWVGKTIVALNVRQKYNINIVSIKSNSNTMLLPPADYKFKERDTLMVLGNNKAIDNVIKKL